MLQTKLHLTLKVLFLLKRSSELVFDLPPGEDLTLAATSVSKEGDHSRCSNNMSKVSQEHNISHMHNKKKKLII